MDSYVEEDEEEVDQVEPLERQTRKVTFADVVGQAAERNNFPEKAKEA